MKWIKRIAIILVVIVAALAVFAWWGFRDRAPVENQQIGSKMSSKQVLIATQDYEFRNQIANTVTKALEEEGCYIEMIDVQNILESNIENFDVVIILDTVKAWKLHKNTRAFMDKAKNKNKIIVVPCAGAPDLKMNIEGVDVISAASPQGNQESIANDILEKVRERF
jgi:predicted nicotinamide N-methyase